MIGDDFRADPRRTLWWRYDCALALFRTGAAAEFGEDEYVVGALAFLRELSVALDRDSAEAGAGGPDADLSQRLNDLFSRRPNPWAACQVHFDRKGETRALLKSHLLADASDEEIAAICGVTPAAVEWYEKLFFHVRGSLAAADWLLDVLEGRPASTDIRDGGWSDLEGPWAYRRFTYSVGPHGLDELLHFFPNQGVEFRCG